MLFASHSLFDICFMGTSDHHVQLEFVYMIPDTSLHQHNDVGVFDLDNLFCFQSDLFC